MSSQDHILFNYSSVLSQLLSSKFNLKKVLVSNDRSDPIIDPCASCHFNNFDYIEMIPDQHYFLRHVRCINDKSYPKIPSNPSTLLKFQHQALMTEISQRLI
ncbi:Uncharacterized protein QTN25_009374 [Entamoeba marina]